MAPLGVGIVGYGVMGQRMARMILNHGGFKVVAGFDLTSDLVPSEVRKDTPEEVCRDPNVQVVYIATPPASHCSYVQLAAKYGKHVFVEKPLSVSLQDGEQIVQAMKIGGIQSAVDFPLANMPSDYKLREILSSGVIGTPLQLRMRFHFQAWPRDFQASCSWLGKRVEGGFVREVVSHFVDMTHRQLGLFQISNHAVKYPTDISDGAETEVTATGYIQQSDVKIGVDIFGTVGKTDSGEDIYEWTVQGTKGAVKMMDWVDLQMKSDGEWRKMPVDSEPFYGKLQLDALLGRIEGRAVALPTVEDAFEVQKVIESLLS